MDFKDTNYFGLETIKKLYESQLKRKEDAVVLLMHWMLTKNGFRCIGLGDGREIAGDESQSELLPENWNDDTTYLLRYMFSDRLYILKITKTSEDVMINFIKADDMKISSILIKGTDISEDGLKEEMIYLDKMDKELVSSFLEKPVPKPQAHPRNDTNPYLLGSGRGRPMPYPNFGEIGRRDLDPFGAGSGMLLGRNDINNQTRPPYRFDPLYPGQSPRGFDPFGQDPDNDMFFPPCFQ